LNKSNQLTFTVRPEDSNIRLDKWLSAVAELKDFVPTRSFAQNMIDKNEVTVNGKIAKSSLVVKENDLVMVIIPEKVNVGLVPYNFKLDIIFEDNDIIVVNKPAGLVVHPAAGHEQDTLVNALLNHTQQLSVKNELRPGIVHRIDKETSGLLVIAKNDVAHDILAEQFKEKTTHRIYYAIAEGKKTSTQGTIRSFLARHPHDRKKYCSLRQNNQIIRDPQFESSVGKWAVTHYEVIESAQNKHLLRLKLETGRTHQIRIHMSELGLPLVGDVTYGYSTKSTKEQNLNRFYLHAAELGFTHPKTQDNMIFKVSWPESDLVRISSWGFQFYVQGNRDRV